MLLCSLIGAVLNLNLIRVVFKETNVKINKFILGITSIILFLLFSNLTLSAPIKGIIGTGTNSRDDLILTLPTTVTQGFTDTTSTAYHLSRKSSSGKLYKTASSTGYGSTDNGENWTILDSTGSCSTGQCTDEIFLVTSTNTLIGVYNVGGTICHIFRSTDDGENWSDVHTFSTVCSSSGGTFTRDIITSRLWTLTQTTAAYSDDDGATWTDINNASLGSPTSIDTITAYNNNIIIGQIGGTANAAPLSLNGGSSWTTLTNADFDCCDSPALNIDIAEPVFIPYIDTWFIYISPNTQTTSFIYKSTDKGQTWTQIIAWGGVSYDSASTRMLSFDTNNGFSLVFMTFDTVGDDFHYKSFSTGATSISDVTTLTNSPIDIGASATTPEGVSNFVQLPILAGGNQQRLLHLIDCPTSSCSNLTNIYELNP